MGKDMASCVDCGTQGCCGSGKGYPAFCLTEALDDAERAEVMACYEDRDNRRIMETASNIEHEFYGRYSRVQETIEFAHRLGVKRVGIATCAGLIEESRTLRRLLERAGFRVFGVICKIGEESKVDFGLDPASVETGASICNPIMQAHLLEEAGTELNIVMGLCVGHDSLFYRYSHTLTTTLVTKDRVTGHNPCVVLHTADTLFRRRLDEQIDGYASKGAGDAATSR